MAIRFAIVELAGLFKVSTDYLLGVESTSSVNVSGLTQADIALVNTIIHHLRHRASTQEGT